MTRQSALVLYPETTHFPKMDNCLLEGWDWGGDLPTPSFAVDTLEHRRTCILRGLRPRWCTSGIGHVPCSGALRQNHQFGRIAGKDCFRAKSKSKKYLIRIVYALMGRWCKFSHLKECSDHEHMSQVYICDCLSS